MSFLFYAFKKQIRDLLPASLDWPVSNHPHEVEVEIEVGKPCDLRQADSWTQLSSSFVSDS